MKKFTNILKTFVMAFFLWFGCSQVFAAPKYVTFNGHRAPVKFVVYKGPGFTSIYLDAEIPAPIFNTAPGTDPIIDFPQNYKKDFFKNLDEQILTESEYQLLFTTARRMDKLWNYAERLAQSDERTGINHAEIYIDVHSRVLPNLSDKMDNIF